MHRTTGRKCVAVIAGEASGDIHGAGVVRAMSRQNHQIFFCGIGGPALEAAGVRILVDSAELSVVGITEVFNKIRSIYRGAVTIKRLLKSLKPDLLILVDYPEFNLHIATVAKKYAIPVLYYVSPQIWAWRQGRVKKIGERIDHMAVILPFEKEFYDAQNIPVSFVGHPLLDSASPNHDSPGAEDSQESPVIGLVPGSRKMEVARLLPIMIQAAHNLKTGNPQYRFIISIAPTV